MIKYSLAFHEDTATDYDDAYFWYEEQQQGLGEKFLSAVRSTLQLITNNPETFSEK